MPTTPTTLSEAFNQHHSQNKARALQAQQLLQAQKSFSKPKGFRKKSSTSSLTSSSTSSKLPEPKFNFRNASSVSSATTGSPTPISPTSLYSVSSRVDPHHPHPHHRQIRQSKSTGNLSLRSRSAAKYLEKDLPPLPSLYQQQLDQYGANQSHFHFQQQHPPSLSLSTTIPENPSRSWNDTSSWKSGIIYQEDGYTDTNLSRLDVPASFETDLRSIMTTESDPTGFKNHAGKSSANSLHERYHHEDLRLSGGSAAMPDPRSKSPSVHSLNIIQSPSVQSTISAKSLKTANTSHRTGSLTVNPLTPTTSSTHVHIHKQMQDQYHSHCINPNNNFGSTGNISPSHLQYPESNATSSRKPPTKISFNNFEIAVESKNNETSSMNSFVINRNESIISSSSKSLSLCKSEQTHHDSWDEISVPLSPNALLPNALQSEDNNFYNNLQLPLKLTNTRTSNHSLSSLENIFAIAPSPITNNNNALSFPENSFHVAHSTQPNSIVHSDNPPPLDSNQTDLDPSYPPSSFQSFSFSPDPDNAPIRHQKSTPNLHLSLNQSYRDSWSFDFFEDPIPTSSTSRHRSPSPTEMSRTEVPIPVARPLRPVPNPKAVTIDVNKANKPFMTAYSSKRPIIHRSSSSPASPSFNQSFTPESNAYESPESSFPPKNLQHPSLNSNFNREPPSIPPPSPPRSNQREYYNVNRFSRTSSEQSSKRHSINTYFPIDSTFQAEQFEQPPCPNPTTATSAKSNAQIPNSMQSSGPHRGSFAPHRSYEKRENLDVRRYEEITLPNKAASCAHPAAPQGITQGLQYSYSSQNATQSSQKSFVIPTSIPTFDSQKRGLSQSPPTALTNINVPPATASSTSNIQSTPVPYLARMDSPNFQRRLSKSRSDYVNKLREIAMYHDNPEPEPEPDTTDPEAQKRIRTKFNLIRELVNTEETFMADLEIVSKIYGELLLKNPYCDHISGRDILSLFTNLEQVLLLSRRFVSHLRECIPSYILTECDISPPLNGANGTILEDIVSNVGEVILEYIPNMEMTYSLYCAQSENQLNTFYRLNTQGSPMIDKWLLECRELSKSKTQAWTLDALLIKPVQRLMKYPLLLTSMLKVTPVNHPDHFRLKQALTKMQETANRINSIDPESDSHPTNTSDTSSPDYLLPRRTSSKSLDYNTMMSQLKSNPRCDEELEILSVQFDRKQRHVNNLIKYLRGHIQQIQKHFDVTSALGHAWSSWSSLSEDGTHSAEHTRRIKVYRRFAMFSLPFTTSSSAHVSTNNLFKRIEIEAIRPLHEIWIGYNNVSSAMTLRENCHASYQRYIEWKASNQASDEEEQLDAVTLANADTFLRLHNKLKNELPELFSMTEEIIDSCLVRYLAIQRDWFRIAVDSTSNVFGLTLGDIRTSRNQDPIIETFNQAQSPLARKVIDEDLAICKFRQIMYNNLYNPSMSSIDLQKTQSSRRSSASSMLSMESEQFTIPITFNSSMDELHYTTSLNGSRPSPLDDDNHTWACSTIIESSHNSLISASVSNTSTLNQNPLNSNTHRKNKPSMASRAGSPALSSVNSLQTTMSNTSTNGSLFGDPSAVRRRSSLLALSGWPKRGRMGGRMRTIAATTTTSNRS